MYHVIYNVVPLIVYEYDVRSRSLCNGNPLHIPLQIPLEWRTDVFNTRENMSSYRLNAMSLVHDETELILLVHIKETSVVYFVNYCLYLEPQTFRPLYYIPFPVMTDVAARIVFPMSIVCTDLHYHISCGIMDEVAGILTYDRVEWDALRLPFPK